MVKLQRDEGTVAAAVVVVVERFDSGNHQYDREVILFVINIFLYRNRERLLKNFQDFSILLRRIYLFNNKHRIDRFLAHIFILNPCVTAY